MNLWTELVGEQPEPPTATKGGGPIRCTCGRRIGVEADGAVWTAGYDHTPAGAADIVFSTALEDFELAVEREDAEAVAVIPEFLRRANRRGDGDLSALAAVLPRLRVPARIVTTDQLQAEPGTDAHRAGGPWAPMGCTRCRTIYDARQVVSAARRNKRGELLAERAVSVADTTYWVPPAGLSGRVDMYRRLSVVLPLQHSAS